MEALLTTTQDDSSSANPNSVKSDDSSPHRGSGSTSPPPNCAICLGTCKNKSFTDSCLHQFCFTCLLTWSKVKAECPLCKQAFRSIIHNVRSNHQYEEYLVVRQNEDLEHRIQIDRFAANTHRYRYRTTFTLPRRETIAIQQLLRHYPMVAGMVPPINTHPPPPVHHHRAPIPFRRTVYRHNLWARLLPDFSGRFRDCTPEFYRYNTSQIHRLLPWLNRELNYLLNENVGHISYVLSRILDNLPRYHINSPEFRHAMQRYFGDKTEHFLHELYCFASTPYDLAGYDRHVQYTTITPPVINEVISSSDSDASVDSDIVMVSRSEPAEAPPGPSRVPAPIYPQTYISQPSTDNVIPIETISHSDTDDDSSEVMVVGYIKPPQDRTPEIVDLLGSDSDVIVQDVQPEPSGSAVKVTLKRHRSQSNWEEERSRSGSDSSYVPSPAKRRRRGRSDDSTTSDSSLSTPERRDRAGFHSPTSLSAHVGYTSTSSDCEPRSTQSKYKKRSSTTARSKRRSKRPSRSHQIDVKDIPLPDGDKRQSKKSLSGKGVKSSNKNSESSSLAPEPMVTAESKESSPEQIPNASDQPSTSGISSNHQKRKSSRERNRRRRSSRESRRLRSVVNVMYNGHSKTQELNANCSNVSNVTSTSIMTDDELLKLLTDTQTDKSERCQYVTPPRSRQLESSSDSEDNLPLNLTLQKVNATTTS